MDEIKRQEWMGLSGATQAELEIIARTTPLILVRCSRDLRYAYVNHASAALFGLTPEQMIGRPIAEVMGAEAFAIIKPYIDRVLQGEAVQYEAQVPYPSAGTRWMNVSYIPHRDGDGQVSGWIASIVDVTDAKRAE
ncbi:MAG TPA: PAS domain-containing protein, partial [Terriglobales bacterium]|nr:PAS domain-containing protein [Terriglobales bacterium]